FSEPIHDESDITERLRARTWFRPAAVLPPQQNPILVTSASPSPPSSPRPLAASVSISSRTLVSRLTVDNLLSAAASIDSDTKKCCLISSMISGESITTFAPAIRTEVNKALYNRINEIRKQRTGVSTDELLRDAVLSGFVAPGHTRESMCEKCSIPIERVQAVSMESLRTREELDRTIMDESAGSSSSSITTNSSDALSTPRSNHGAPSPSTSTLKRSARGSTTAKRVASARRTVDSSSIDRKPSLSDRLATLPSVKEEKLIQTESTPEKSASESPVYTTLANAAYPSQIQASYNQYGTFPHYH
ncbi:hypothetical protein PFISCL1PPCAC_15089, partial [Pristionchus fissidentatus]